VPSGPWRLRVKSRLLMAAEGSPGPVAALSGALRRRVDRAFQAAGPAGPTEDAGQQGKALARALVLGDVSGLPLAWKRGLRVTGIYHLLSVSGVHVALVAGVVLLLAGWLPRSARLLLMLAAIALYLLVVGPYPALVRSAVMGLLAVLALLVERPPSPANGLAWSVILIVLDSPDAVLSPAFQLTVSATAGLIVVAPLLDRPLVLDAGRALGGVRRGFLGIATTADPDSGLRGGAPRCLLGRAFRVERAGKRELRVHRRGKGHRRQCNLRHRMSFGGCIGRHSGRRMLKVPTRCNRGSRKPLRIETDTRADLQNL
jgi:ComEC/Rec2-related protein